MRTAITWVMKMSLRSNTKISLYFMCENVLDSMTSIAEITLELTAKS